MTEIFYYIIAPHSLCLNTFERTCDRKNLIKSNS